MGKFGLEFSSWNKGGLKFEFRKGDEKRHKYLICWETKWNEIDIIEFEFPSPARKKKEMESLKGKMATAAKERERESARARASA